MKFNNSRRDFVKYSALAGAGLLMPTGAHSMFNVFNEKRLKLAVIGCGGRGSGAAFQALQADSNIELVAMADAFEDRLSSSYSNLAEAYEGTGKVNVKDAHKFVGLDAYKKAIDLADVVILATPPGFRPYHFEYAIENGKHVFMEKPVATDAPGVRKVLEMARKADEQNLKVVVGLQRRYQENYQQIYQQIQEGKIGKITGGQVYWNSSGVWVNPRKPEYSELEYQMRNWYYFNWLCGDHILEQHIHNIDVANWFIGEYPSSAQGMGGREVRNGPDHGQIFDHHFVEFTYPSGAVIASQCRHQPNTMSRVDEVFQATGGTIYTDGNGAGELKARGGRTLYTHNASSDPNPYQQELDELFASIRKGEVINDTENGAKSTQTAIMGRMATYTGQVISWDEAMASNQVLVPAESELDWCANPPVMPDSDGRYPVPVPGETTLV